MKISETLMLGLLLACLAGCQSYTGSIIHNQSISFDEGRYSTFHVRHARKSLEGDYEELINNAIIHVMSEKGYIDAQDPDLEIKYSLLTRADERLEVRNTSEAGHPAHMEAVFEARMLVNVVERSSGNVIWKAAATRDLRQVNIHKFDQDRAIERMEELFSEFPER